MNKKLCVTALVIALCASAVCAEEIERVSINANGYDWLDYTNHEKLFFVALMRTSLGIDTDKYKPECIIRTLDHLYDLAVNEARENPEQRDLDKCLRLPCILMLAGFFDLKVEVIGPHEFAIRKCSNG